MFAADKPIRHVEDDKYGREKYVDNLAYALLTGDDSDGLVVGIEGAWGSGKTSLKNMLIERLQQMPLPDRKTHLIEFDAWMYSRSGEIVSALFSEISAGLSPRLKWYQKLLMRFDCFNNNAITSVVHLIYRAINAVLPYSEIGISIGCISWSFQNFNEIYVMLRLAKTVRDIKLSKSKKEKGGLSNESKEVENESSWSCSSSYGCRRSTYSVGY